MTENDLLEAVAGVLAQGYTRPGPGQTIMPPTDWDFDMARSVIARVRAHDAAEQAAPGFIAALHRAYDTGASDDAGASTRNAD